MESDQHPGCSVSTYFKMQKGAFLPQTFKAFPEEPRGASVPSPARLVRPAWLNTMMVATAWWWVAAKRHPRVPGERRLPGPPCLHLPNTYGKRGKSVERPECAQLRLSPTPRPPLAASDGFSSQLQLPTAVWEVDLGLGRQ